MNKWQWNEMEFWAVTATFAHQQFWACLSTQNKFCSQPLHLWLKVDQWMFQMDSWHLAWVFFGFGISLMLLSCQMVLEWHRRFASLVCEMCCDRLEFHFNPFFLVHSKKWTFFWFTEPLTERLSSGFAAVVCEIDGSLKKRSKKIVSRKMHTNSVQKFHEKKKKIAHRTEPGKS